MYFLFSQEAHSIKVIKLANEQIAKYEAEVCMHVQIISYKQVYIVMYSETCKKYMYVQYSAKYENLL